MMMGKLPNWRRTSSLEHFMRNFWSLSSQCLCIQVEFRNNYNATNSWECLSHIFECQITILTGKKSTFSMYFLSSAKRSNWTKYYRYFILRTSSSLVVNSNQKNHCFRRIFQVQLWVKTEENIIGISYCIHVLLELYVLARKIAFFDIFSKFSYELKLKEISVFYTGYMFFFSCEF